jgi:hypothetical protein
MNEQQIKIFNSNTRFTDSYHNVISMGDAINDWITKNNSKINIISKDIVQSGAMYLTIIFWYENK